MVIELRVFNKKEKKKEEEKHGQNGKIIFCYNFAQTWYFSERFDTQLIFDMHCAVNSLKVNEIVL